MKRALKALRWSLLLPLLAALTPGPDTTGAAYPLAARSQRGGGGEPPPTFIPSEKVPADSAVSFPVDI